MNCPYVLVMRKKPLCIHKILAHHRRHAAPARWCAKIMCHRRENILHQARGVGVDGGWWYLQLSVSSAPQVPSAGLRNLICARHVAD